MMQVHANRAVREPELPRDLFAPHLLHEPQREGLAVALGERAQRAEHVVHLEAVVDAQRTRLRHLLRSASVGLSARWCMRASLRAIVASHPPNAAGSRSVCSCRSARKKTSWSRSGTSSRGACASSTPCTSRANRS
jgi:hypothetical protein